jgi:hypothetical protein
MAGFAFGAVALFGENMSKKTDEQRLKELQARIDKRKKIDEHRKAIETARKALKALRG